MWYTYLNEYLKWDYMSITLFVYVYSVCEIFAIVIVYVEYLNFAETPKEFTRIVDYLNSKFEMKDLKKIKNLPRLANRVLFK